MSFLAKYGASTVPTPDTGGFLSKYSQPVVPTAAPVSKVASPGYFGTTTSAGSIYGPSPEKDPSGRPFLEYRNPGDTATTTDRTRVDTTFDPFQPKKVTRDDFYNPRTVEGVSKLKIAMGGSYSDELDHGIALALSGSNDPKNLRPIPAKENQSFGKLERKYQLKVINGEMSLGDAQTALAQEKGLPVPWTPAELREIKKNGFTEFFKNTVEPKTKYPKIKLPTTAGNNAQSTPATSGASDTVQDVRALGSYLFSPVEQEVRRPFETGTTKVNLPKSVTGLASLGRDVLEAIPKAAATVYGELLALERKTGEVNLGVDARRLGFSDPKYVTATKEVTDRVNAGENPFVVALDVGSHKTLDVAFGASLFSGIAKMVSAGLLSEGLESKILASKTLNGATSVEEGEAAAKKITKQAFDATKNYPIAQRESIMADVTNTNNKALAVLKEKGAPTLLDQVRFKASQVSELAGRQTPLGKGSDFLAPDFGLKQAPVPRGVVGGYLPGTADVNPNQFPMGLSTKAVKTVGKETPELTTTILNKLEGKTTVSKQFISDLTNSGEVKQVERDLIRKHLEKYPNGQNIPVAQFIKAVQADLLPLKVSSSAGGETRYEGVTLPEDVRGDVADYEERVYQSPIKTSAGQIHFSGEDNTNYFGHVRSEDMSGSENGVSMLSGPNQGTRRIIEVQSDLYQKGNLEKEQLQKGSMSIADEKKYATPEELKQWEGFSQKNLENGLSVEEKDTWENLSKELFSRASKDRSIEISKLSQYNNPTAHFRMVREEIRKAAIDGKTKLQFPTGQTAMQIEGLGSVTEWFKSPGNQIVPVSQMTRVTPNSLKVGEFIRNRGQSDWIITEVLGDGKFKAISPHGVFPNETGYLSADLGYKSVPNKKGYVYKEGDTETFDISGKVDTNNPIYRFYEKDLGRYLKNKYDARIVTDDKGVTWYEISPSGEKSVEAFKTKDNGEVFDISKKDADTIIRKLFTEREMKFAIRKEIIDEDGRLLSGRFTRKEDLFSKQFKNLIEVIEQDGKVSSRVLFHEAFHGYLNVFISDSERTAILNRVKKNPALFQQKMYDKSAYKTADERAEEWLADDFADFVKRLAGGEKINSPFKAFYMRVLNSIRALIRKFSKFDKLYKDILKGERPSGEVIKGEFSASNLQKGEVSQVDKLIAQGKVRVVSREGTDIYQIRKGGEWVNVRDEASAIKQFTPKQEPELPRTIQEKQAILEIKKEALDNSPFKSNENRFLVDKEGRVRELGDVKNPALTRKIEDRMAEAGIKDPTEFAKGVEDYLAQKKEFENAEAVLKSEIKESKKPTQTLETQKEVQTIAKSEGEVRSIEAQANQALQDISYQDQKEVSSLTKMIDNITTDVKQKVNILDYLRTPDRVLKKIGFSKEANMIRKGYEAYVKELPKNIDKITKWSRAVPKESNERIFKYLDGQPIDLNPEEKKVALEIKDWLAGWALRLNLPKDKQITNYITHIFDEQLVKKEFDEDLAKIITDKIPGSVYDPFLLSRLGAKGFKQDTWAALDAYAKRATRKVNMDPALEAIKNKTGENLELSNIEASQFKFIQRYVNNINMRPTELDNLVDNGIKSIFGYTFGQRPVTRLAKLLRRLTFRGMLGLNPGSALRNISQGINTYAVLGEKYTTIGYLKLFNKGAMAELNESGVLSDEFIQDRTLSSTKKAMEKIDKGLFLMFETAEKVNRGSAYFGAKAKALAEGKTPEQAVEYAKEVVRKTQFTFGSVDTPVFLQNDFVKTFTQFQTYTVKQIEFLGEMAKDKNFMGLLRYAVAGLVFVYTVGKAFNMKPEQLIPSFRFDTPPSLKVPVEVTKALLNTPDKYGKPRDLKTKASDIGQSLINLVPAGAQIKKTVEGAQAVNQGGSYDAGGNLQFNTPQSTLGKAQTLLFGKYSTENAQDYFNKTPTPMEKLYTEVQSLKASGKTEEAQKLVDDLSDDEYAKYKKVRSAAIAKATTQAEKEMAPTVVKVQNLIKAGKKEEAQAIVDQFTDEEYRIYGLVKKQLK